MSQTRRSTSTTAPQRPLRCLPLLLCLLLLPAAAALTGCSSLRVTDPPRTATEQFLLSRAAALAVQQLSFEPLRGRKVFVDPSYFAASEQAFVLGEMRARMLMDGIQLVEKREQAQVIMEVRSGGVGIDRKDFLLGIPSIFLSGPAQEAAGAGTSAGPPIVTPEIAISKNRKQDGIASVAYVAYWADTGQVVAVSGPFIGHTLRDDWWFVGAGPKSTGNIPPTELREK